MSIPPPTPLSYEGSVAVPWIIRNFPPTTAFNNFDVPTIWINPLAGTSYILVAKPLGVANWLLMSGGSGSTIQIDTPDLAMVFPVAGVINFANGTGMNITGAGNTVTFNSTTSGGFTWVNVTGTTQTLVNSFAYLANNAGLVTFSLPATAAFGDVFIIAGYGVGGWTLDQAGGQSVVVGAQTSTVGVAGSISSSFRQDTVQIVCAVANTVFKVINLQGNIQVA